MVDLSRRAVFSMTDILSQNDKTSSSICHLSSNIPHIPILHSHGIVPDSSTTHDWPIISNVSLGVSSHFDGLLDVVEKQPCRRELDGSSTYSCFNQFISKHSACYFYEQACGSSKYIGEIIDGLWLFFKGFVPHEKGEVKQSICIY